MKYFKLIWLPTLVAILSGCHPSSKQGAESAEPKVEGDRVVLPQDGPQLASFSIAAVESSRGSPVRLNGRLVWDDDVTVRIFAPFAGRIAKIVANVGDPVKCQDALAMIASPDYGQAQADARRAESDFRQAERGLNRMRELFEHGAAAKKDWEAAESDFERASSEKARAAERLRLYGGSEGIIDQVCPLKSPLDGVVVEKNINPGQEVRPDQMLANAPQFFSPLFVVTNPARMWVLLDVSEKDLPFVQPGQTVAIHTQAFPDRVFTGTIDVVSDFLDPSTRTVKVRGHVSNGERLLKAEMFVTVDLPANHREGSDISAKAVFLKGEKHYVFVEEDRGRYARREVKVGPEHDGKILVLEGLQPGQRVVTDGCLLLEQLYQAGGTSGT